MRPVRRPLLAPLVTLVTATVTGALVLTPAAAAPAPVAAPAGATSAAVTYLPTGDAVSVRSLAGGRVSLQVATTAQTGPASMWSSAQAGARSYVFPMIAKPYLGRVLDPELFDVGLAPSTTAIPLDLTFTAGTTPALPGFTVTSATATSMHGYLTRASAKQFGAALLTQWKRDAVAGRPAPTSLFGANHIARSDATPAAAALFPQVTLVLKVLAPDGTTAPFGLVGVINTDDARKYVGFAFVTNGEARVSVPTGHYSFITDATTFDPVAGTVQTSIVTVPDYTVTSNLQRVVLDTSTATVAPGVSTPRPAALTLLDLEWDRSAGQGALSFGYEFGPGSKALVAPAPAPEFGTADWLTHWALGASPAGQTPYRYDLSYDDSGAIPADQHRTVAAAQLGRVDANYHTDGPPRLPLFGRAAVYPFQFFIFTALLQQPGPLSRTEYLAAPPSAAWSDIYVAASSPENFFAGEVDDGLRLYPAGSRRTVDWLRGPLAPGIASPTDGSSFYFSTACRTSARMEIALAPFLDSTPGHTGSVYAPDPSTTVAKFTLRRDGELVFRRTNAVGVFTAVPSTRSVYEATVETFLGAAGIATSTHAVTTLTFPSGGGGAQAPIPDGWYCPAGRDATVLPLLLATVPLPTDLANTMPVGANTFTFTIAPAAGAPAATVIDPALSISLDSGSTFRNVPVTALGGNRFQATITHTAGQAGASVSVRVSGRTAAGSAITETVDNAYVVQES